MQDSHLPAAVHTRACPAQVVSVHMQPWYQTLSLHASEGTLFAPCISQIISSPLQPHALLVASMPLIELQPHARDAAAMLPLSCGQHFEPRNI